MSAFIDDRDGPDRIPEDAPIREIAPDDFVARSSEQTFRAALRKLERETASRVSQLPRCPDCGSVNIRKKSPHAVVATRIDTAFRCAHQGCRAHFDEPAPSREQAMPGEQATFEEVQRR